MLKEKTKLEKKQINSVTKVILSLKAFHYSIIIVEINNYVILVMNIFEFFQTHTYIISKLHISQHFIIYYSLN